MSNVTSMGYMFSDATSFNQDLSSWDVSNVGDMNSMFAGANALSDYNKCAIHTSFSSNDNWPYDWSNYCVFTPFTKEELQTAAVDLWVDDNATALETYGEINTWDVSFLTDMSNIFENKSTFDNDISGWDVSNVTNMRQMFIGADNFNQNLNTWDVSNYYGGDVLFNRFI